MFLDLEKVKEEVTRMVSHKRGKQISEIMIAGNISGGSISQAFKIKTNLGTFFVKVNDAAKYPQMFNKESKGLNILRSVKVLNVPEAIGVKEDEALGILVLEYLESGSPSKNFWEDFGIGLSKLHQTTHTQFGLDHNNYIGSLVQVNTLKENWIDFFIENRLEIQLKGCRNKGLIGNELLQKFERLYKELPSIIPVEKPSLLHGDLWNGNYLLGCNGKVVIFDPAIYYGHREIDIAMTLLFGGFDVKFYQAYNQNAPLEHNWEGRVGIFQLYPLLVHLNLFGSGYIGAIENIVKKY